MQLQSASLLAVGYHLFRALLFPELLSAPTEGFAEKLAPFRESMQRIFETLLMVGGLYFGAIIERQPRHWLAAEALDVRLRPDPFLADRGYIHGPQYQVSRL